MEDTWKYHLSGNAHKRRRNNLIKKSNKSKSNIFKTHPDSASDLANYVHNRIGLDITPSEVNALLIYNGVIKSSNRGYVNTDAFSRYTATCVFGKQRSLYVRYKTAFRDTFLQMVKDLKD